ncbi:MAG: hypothetical protein ACK5LP_00870 [Campylobacteraceae bacterium]
MDISGSWSCSHLKNNKCYLLKKECEPNQKGCVLYKKTTFAPKPTFLETEEEKLQKKFDKLLGKK